MSSYEDRTQERAAGSDDEDSDDEEDDGLYPQDTDAHNRKKLFREAIEAIRTQCSDQTQSRNPFEGRELDEFITKYKEAILHSIDDPVAPTLLHSIVQLAKHTNIRSATIQPLVGRIVEAYPPVLCFVNDKGESPLYLAIGYKKWMIVGSMLDNCSNSPKVLAEAIAIPCKNENNKTSLHLALEKDLRPQVTERLVQSAEDDALGKKDKTGKTPLHYAVNYAQFSDARATIIDLFIDRDERLVARLKQKNAHQPVETFLDQVDNSGLSIYRHHLETATSYTPSKILQAGDGDSRKPMDQGRIEFGTTLGSVRRVLDLKILERQRDSKLESAVRPRERERGREPRLRGRPGDSDRQGDDREPGWERGSTFASDPRARDRGGKQQEVDEREMERRRLREEERGIRDRDLGDQDRGRPLQGRGDEGQHALDGWREDVAKPRGDMEILKLEPPLSIVTSGNMRAEPSPNTPIKRVRTGKLGGIEVKKQKSAARSGKKTSEKPDPASLARNSERILTRLKLHYMRTRHTESAIAFLYGINVEGIEICFEYSGLPEQIREDVFIKSFGADQESGIKFDKILQYVSFPKVVVKRTPRRNAPDDTNATERRDMQFFFEWLYEKGVRHIIKVNVDDTSSPAHSDEAIQRSLEKIVIEQLNWHKVDLDPCTICRAGTRLGKEPGKPQKVPSELTEVALRWSGSNAVLRAWSEPEGLPLLPKLTKVQLFTPSAPGICDSQTWVSKNIDLFQVRLNKNVAAAKAASKSAEKDETRRLGQAQTGETAKDTEEQSQVNVFRVHEATGKSQKVLVGSSDTSGSGSASTQVFTSHQWLDCMDLFANKFKPFWEQTLKDFLELRGERAAETAEGVEKDVVVALIDDGVDSCDDALVGQILDGKTFDYQDECMGPHFVSAKGHGTLMASLINRVCPMAKIYPIRLKTLEGKDGSSEIDVKSAALAIQAALDKGATIISMSWTVPVPEEDSEEKALLTKILDRAVKSKALMFCSSPDSGKFTVVDYPTAHHRERFFRIGAAKDNGTVSHWAGPLDSLDFILPGVDVVRSHSTEPLFNKIKEIRSETGSSVATALAAGLAATIIYCVKACALAFLTSNRNNGGDENVLKIIPPGEANRIAEHANMKEAINKLGTLTEDRFIQVWESFGPVNEVLKDDLATSKRKLESLIALATKLTPIRR